MWFVCSVTSCHSLTPSRVIKPRLLLEFGENSSPHVFFTLTLYFVTLRFEVSLFGDRENGKGMCCAWLKGMLTDITDVGSDFPDISVWFKILVTFCDNV